MSTKLHPAIAAMFEHIPFPVIGPDTLDMIRNGGLIAAPVELSDAVERTDHAVSEHASVRVHRPKGASSDAMPCLYSIHGGGYVLGSNAMDDQFFDVWCQRTGLVGVSVEYRLAPENPYPGPLDDCYAGLSWTFANAASLGIDPARVGIRGVSAGGGLCAALALLARDRGEFRLAYQLLDCPMVDDRQATVSSQADGLIIWSRESNEFGWRSYLGSLYGSGDVPGYAAPARSDDLSGLPPAYVCVGAADGFRDEDVRYAQRLMEAGVPTELHVYPGAPHGAMLFAGTAVGDQYQRDQSEWLGRAIAGELVGA